VTALALVVTTRRLYNGRRSFYLNVAVMGRRWWVQRWDTARAPLNRFRSGTMGWTWGAE
jgi:hypothetical protein